MGILEQLPDFSYKVPEWFNGALPASTILLAILTDILWSLPYPKPLTSLFFWLSTPFRNFLVLEDLLDPVDATPRISRRTQKLLLSVACAEVIGWVGCLSFGISTQNNDYLTKSLVLLISWGYVAVRLSTKAPVTPPYLFIVFASIQALESLIAFGHDLSVGSGTAFLDIIAILGTTYFAWLAGTLPLKSYRPSLNVAKGDDIPTSDLSMPEDSVTLWEWCSFTFLQPILNLAMKRTLNENDVWTLSPFFLHKNIFAKCLDYRHRNPKHSLLRFLLVSNSLDLILNLSLDFWGAVIGFVPTYALQQILGSFAPETAKNSHPYFWTLVTFISHLSFAQVDVFELWHSRRCYERTRGQIFCLLHYKALKRQDVSGRVNKPGDTESADLGKIVNLMQGDAYAVAQRFWDFSPIFMAPVRIAIAMTFLYNILGWSSFAGVAAVFVVFALNYPLGKYSVSITRSSWKAKDERMNIVNELLQNIRFLKFYGWEYTWSRKAEEAREVELKWRIKQNIVAVITSFIWIWLPSATALTSFLCYTIVAKQRLTVEKAFPALTLFSQLQGPMIALPGQVFSILHAYVSMQRIETFLKEPEVPAWASTFAAETANGPDDGDSDIGFEEASFEWEENKEQVEESSRFRLGPLNITFPAGKLSLVSGATGSGKSALLAALLGEMHCAEGRVKICKTNHRVAYCAQNPWLEHATIKDNITFGSPASFDEVRYDAVLDACALRQDLAIFPAGDLTEIGEKGITLSGGQRARIALARAMYSQAKYILMDDPLAAVDMHTAQHLVSHCLSGELARGRTIILVTHHITLCLPIATYLVELDRGKVLHQGPISELAEKGILFNVIKAEEEPFTEDQPPTSPINEADVISKRPILNSVRSSGNGKLVEVEARAEGRVALQSYWAYIKAAGFLAWFVTILLLVFIRAINIANQAFLGSWGRAYDEKHPKLITIQLQAPILKLPWLNLPPPDVDVKPWLMIYLYISAAGAFSVLGYIAVGYYASLQACRSLFLGLLRRLTRAPARFFDTTPIGRILNRFTTDINTIDDALQNSARAALSGILTFLASFGVMLYFVPSFAPFALFIAWLYFRLAPEYVQASRDLRRLESVSLSPAFAGFDEMLRGIVHIRAFAMERRYQDRFYTRVDKFQSLDHVYWLVNGWLMWRYDCLGSIVVFTATMFALWAGIDKAQLAMVIVQAGTFADASRALVRVAAQLELDFNSVERVLEYLEVDQEAPAVMEKNRPPAYWPSNSGSLVVEDLVVRYAPHLPDVLHRISFTVEPSEKIGVVGRTGSGKSTLAMSLLRIIEATEGRIMIDGIDIGTLGLEDLRTRVTIVSQDVSLFSGTIRSNLDPLGICTTEECLQVLERCHLLPLLNHKPTEEEPTVLDMQINHGSLSAGEKQLLALARAMLRRSNIIVMDEATSQIDSNLDDQIQRTIREELSHAIVITIAHRLKTVMDYDRILVLDEGHIAEFDSPHVLLKISRGVFRDMCKKSADWPLFAKMAGSRSRGPSEGSAAS